jgi:MEMO1 family protein
MLISSYFVPHSPLLVPRIAKNNAGALSQTTASFQKIIDQLIIDKPDSLIILSSHAQVDSDTFNLNLTHEYKIDLSEFGDLTTKQTWRPDVPTINHLAYELSKVYDTNLHTQETLDYGSAIPLLLLTEKLPSIRIVPITFSQLPLPEFYRLGISLEKELSVLNKKFVIIATGDLSHRLTKESPSGFSKQAVSYDAMLKRTIEQLSFNELLYVKERLLRDVGQCSIRSLLILAGAMSNKNVIATNLSYENSLGIGYLTSRFDLH